MPLSLWRYAVLSPYTPHSGNSLTSTIHWYLGLWLSLPLLPHSWFVFTPDFIAHENHAHNTWLLSALTTPTDISFAPNRPTTTPCTCLPNCSTLEISNSDIPHWPSAPWPFYTLPLINPTSTSTPRQSAQHGPLRLITFAASLTFSLCHPFISQSKALILDQSTGSRLHSYNRMLSVATGNQSLLLLPLQIQSLI